MEPAIIIQHHGTIITYDEGRDLFCFELRGRQRTAESLRKAKEAIDAPPPKQRKPFARFKAWNRQSVSWGTSDYVEVEVTSIAEERYAGQAMEVWINNSVAQYRQRAKVSVYDIFPRNEKNDAIIAEWKERHERIKALQTEQQATVKKLKPYVIPKED